MDSGRGQESGQLFQEFQRREDDASCAVGPRVLQFVVNVAVRGLGESFFGDSGAGSVADQLFESGFIGAPSRDGSVEGETHEAYCQWSCEFGLRFQVIFFELLNEATNVLPLTNSESDFVLSTGCLDSCKRVVAIRVVFRNDLSSAIVLLDEIHAFEDAQSSASYFFYAVEEFFVGGVVCRVESHGSFVMGNFPSALDMQHMEVNVKIHMASESLDESDGTSFEVSCYFVIGIFFVEAPLYGILDRSCDDRVSEPKNLSLKFGIASAHVAQGHRHGEDPLTDDGAGGEDVVGEVRSGFGHATGSATSAEAALFATEGDESLVLAIYATEA